jgi:GTPase SAR1 family protein
LLVYSITDIGSFIKLGSIYQSVIRVKESDSEGKIPIILVGNKVDLAQDRRVSKESASKLAHQWGCKNFEVSAKTHESVEIVFKEVIREIRATREDSKGSSKGSKRKSVGNSNSTSHAPFPDYEHNGAKKTSCTLL